MSDILNTIDNAIADCAVSPDAMRWMPEPTEPGPAAVMLPRASVPLLDPIAVASLQGSVRSAFQNLADALSAIAPAFQDLAAADVIPDVGPADPRDRALWLRRNRHTGPRQRQRAPRSISPRRHQ